MEVSDELLVRLIHLIPARNIQTDAAMHRVHPTIPTPLRHRPIRSFSGIRQSILPLGVAITTLPPKAQPGDLDVNRGPRGGKLDAV